MCEIFRFIRWVRQVIDFGGILVESAEDHAVFEMQGMKKKWLFCMALLS
jgi:hypothetical protein